VNTTRFEFNVSVPRNASGALMIRKLAEQAARYVGAEASAEGFGAAVEEAVRAQVNGAVGSGALPIVVRRSDGPVEVVVGSRTIVLSL
jgi:hypothetical protein